MKNVTLPDTRMRRRDYRRVAIFGVAVFVAVFLFTVLLGKFKMNDETEAVSLEGFDAGYIISDYTMGNYTSMTEAEIQSFLDSKVRCDKDESYYNYLVANYPGYEWHFKDGHIVCISEELFGEGETVGTGDTAAHIIWQVAQEYRINPQVLLVLLQKEQGLITDKYPNMVQYRSATGYGCPDTAPCSEQYYGFKNQLRKAAELFRTVLDGGWTNYPLGPTYVQYNPDGDCGGSIVNIRSRATSALYRYTPYQPNAAALAAGYGSAGYCGAYGNRNFYLYFQDWFGGVTEEKGVACEEITDLPTDALGSEAMSWLNELSSESLLSHQCEIRPSEAISGGDYKTLMQYFAKNYNLSPEVANEIDAKVTVSREEAIYYIWRMFGGPTVGDGTFYDVTSNMELLGRVAIIWAYNNGITKYYSQPGEFAPNRDITRREMAIFLWRNAGEPEVNISNAENYFYDLPADELGKKAIIWAYNNGITKYYSQPGEFAPNRDITRREMAIFLWRNDEEEIVGQEVFSDLSETLEEKVAVVWAYSSGITKYYSVPGQFAPNVATSRREAAIFLMRAAALLGK